MAFPEIVQNIFVDNSIALTFVVALVMNLVLPHGDDEKPAATKSAEAADEAAAKSESAPNEEAKANDPEKGQASTSPSNKPSIETSGATCTSPQ